MVREKTIINDEKDLLDALKSYKESKQGFVPLLENCIINYKVELPLDHSRISDIRNWKHPGGIWLEHESSLENVHFKKCDFTNPIKITRDIRGVLLFENCTFTEVVDFSNIKLSGKTRFRECVFNEINFDNTTFENLADFWRCTFKKNTIFYKTDFNEVTVFSASRFEQNVLFTYTLLNKLILFRGTKFHKGLDLSLAIISGEIGSFDMKLEDYDASFTDELVIKELKTVSDKSYNEIYEEIYESFVSEKAIIPIKNKRETFRILKQNLVSQNNINESLKYKLLEKKTLKTELREEKIRIYNDGTNTSWIKQTSKYIEVCFNQFNLWLNKWSNNFESSYGRAFFFVVGVGLFFFFLSIISTDSYIYSNNVLNWKFSEIIKCFVQFLLPTHKFDYLGDEEHLTAGFYVFDFAGRAFVGYGIYQFIQAFRKYK